MESLDRRFHTIYSSPLPSYTKGSQGFITVLFWPTRVLIASPDEQLITLNTVTGATSPFYAYTELGVRCVSWPAEGSIFAVGTVRGTVLVRIYSDAMKSVHFLDDGEGGVRAMSISPDKSYIISVSDNGTVSIWNTATGDQIHHGPPQRSHDLRTLSFSPDGTRIVSASEDSTIRQWQWLSDKAMLQPLDLCLIGHEGAVPTALFSPIDNLTIASGSADMTVRLWDAFSGQQRLRLDGHAGGVNAVAFSPSGRHLASASSDCTVRVWDTLTGDALRVLEGHTDTVLSVVFSPDGTRIVSASYGKSVRVWESIYAEEGRMDIRR